MRVALTGISGADESNSAYAAMGDRNFGGGVAMMGI